MDGLLNVLFAVLVLGALGAIFGLVLAFASRVFSVEVDELTLKLLHMLPGANCGGCGYAGCAMYAQALSKERAAVNKCAPGGTDVAAQIADAMGVKLEKNVRMIAFVKCSGGVNAKKKFEYDGITDCLSASLIGGGGPNECAYGCFGLGSCVKACQFGAISVVDGVAKVDKEKCTGCLMCTKACPRGIIQPISYEADVTIACSSHDKGGVLRKICNIGCLGCSICVKVCPEGAIQVVDNLAVIDNDKCTDCGKCAPVCPRHLIYDAGLPSKQEIEASEMASK